MADRDSCDHAVDGLSRSHSAVSSRRRGLGSRAELVSLQRAASSIPAMRNTDIISGVIIDLVARDPISAVAQYKAAVALNPHSARYWFDLSSAYQVLGDTAQPIRSPGAGNLGRFDDSRCCLGGWQLLSGPR